jgi:hypothetical protein
MIRVAAIIFLTAAAAGALDIVYLRSGERPVRCSIISITDRAVHVKAVYEGESGRGSAKRLIPMSEVDYIDFGQPPAVARLLAQPTADRLEDVRKLWSVQRKHLGRPRSNAGAVGLAYAELMLAGETRARREVALNTFALIEERDWDERRRARAMRGRLRALIATGQADRAIEEAVALADATEDPGLLIEARYVLAVAGFEKLKAFVEENPRWMEDEEVLPEREALFDEAVDQFLYPYLFHGSEEDQAARGLWGARGVYEHAGDAGAARRCAEDIVKLYPETRYAARAKAFLKNETTDERDEDRSK